MSPKRSSNDDEEEWKALLAAFQMYKAAYGDLKVPARFIVPGLAPWPEKAWGLKLGQKVLAIRQTGKFIQNNEARRKKLEDMGFVWRLRSKSQPGKNLQDVSFDQIYAALVTYRKEVQPREGSLKIPANFVVPDCEPWPEATRGLPLGKRVPSLRSKSFLKANPGAKQKLEAIGFEFDAKVVAGDTRYQKVYDALVRYKEIYGDLLVPQPFVVPEDSEEWPEHTWGLRLGARVNAIRSQGTFVYSNPQRRQELDELGFVWNRPASEMRKRGRKRKEDTEAVTGSTTAGDMTTGPLQQDEEDRLVLPTDNQESAESTQSAIESLFGPSSAFGSEPFGASNGKEGGTPKWGFQSQADFEAARAAEEAAKPIADEYKPPKLLSETLKEAANKAVEVGVIESMTENNRIRKGKREKEIPWFNDDFGDDFVFEDVVEALSFYKATYGNFSGLEDEAFVVPAPDGSPGSMFGNDDDDDLSAFDAGASARAAAAIAAFENESNIKESEDLIAAEIRRLQGEDTEVTVVEQARASAVQWPEHLAGMALGNIVHRIRDGSLEVKHLPERKAQLDALDFDWGEETHFIDIPFEKAMCAMYAYYLIRGDMFVYEDFVMPDEDPWPRALAGYELGKAVRRIRELQNFFEAYHIEKVSLLRAIDFVWFPTLALPLDPNEREMSPEMLMVSAMGHPDYAKMIDIPMGLPDKIMADGPFFETDDPKLWWRKWHNWEYVKDYWYAQGRRDNAYVLRAMGYPTLADEHESKYGPGLFVQIDRVMKELEEGVEFEGEKDKQEYLNRLNFFREEMTDCRDIHPQDRRKLLEDLDMAMLSLVSDGKVEPMTRDKFDDDVGVVDAEEETFPDVEEEELEEDYWDDEDEDLELLEAVDEEDEDYEEEDDDFDISDELGLTDADDTDDDFGSDVEEEEFA